MIAQHVDLFDQRKITFCYKNQIKDEQRLSNKSETGKDPKKFREGHPDGNKINQTCNILNNIFTRSLNSPDNCASILLNYFNNFKDKIMEISASLKETEAILIIGEKQISGKTNSVQLSIRQVK